MSTLSEYQQLILPTMMMNKVLSIWPLDQNNSSMVENRLRIVHRTLVFLILTSYSIAVTADFIHHRKDIADATECALIGIAFYLSVVRIVIYTVHQDKLTYIVKTMKTDWEKSNLKDREILKDKCIFVFKLSKYFIFTVISTILAFMFIPLLESVLLGTNERKLPFRGYFYDNQTNYPAYGYLYIYSITSGGLGGCTIAGATSLNLIMVMHGAAKFKVVRKRLEALKSEADNKEEFKECVIQHQSAILFAERVEGTINILALGQFLISSGLLCFAGVQITMVEQAKGDLMKYSSFLNSAIFELFLFSYSGNELMSESEAIGMSIYKSDWIGADFMKSLRIIIMRSFIPSTITAGKFYNMSLMSFTSVLSTAFSYFTVLQTMHSE
ncbi:odorant receptor 13a-like [Chelonus insularis]|uniref:odorant receptor 13a-like n=1 Tax=Chelonus insularis TaxID=460826 RepID=UPI001588B1C5|nr:odorant receptor 13a-like [Chelonus insularis]